jgi:o-succinylbenzoate---CoA ligase
VADRIVIPQISNADFAIFNSPDLSEIGEWLYDRFCQRLPAGWLVGTDGAAIIDSLSERLHQRAEQLITKFSQTRPNFISIATADPIDFIAQLMAGTRLGLPIFLGNPRWGAVEWAQVASLTAQVEPQHQHLIMIPTGGSSGAIKFVTHTWATLSASVWGFQEFYDLTAINTICTLPLYHVSGLMQLCRSLLTDGKLFIVDFRELCAESNAQIDRIEIDRYFISLVPTQLTKLLDLDPQWLGRVQTILLGGAPPSSELLTRARTANLPIALTYGMTETASQITSLKPAEFLAGHNGCGLVLPHAQIEIISAIDRHRSLDLDIDLGALRIQAKSLMLGYFPDLTLPTYFEPDDVGTFDEQGYLTILGRSSNKIISGGENIFPIEVVNAIMATGLVTDAWVTSVPDRYWGQAVTAIYVAKDLSVSATILATAIAGKVSNCKIPKHWIPATTIPRNALGKILDCEVRSLVAHLTIPAEQKHLDFREERIQ